MALPDILFYVFSAFALLCGAMILLSRNPVNSAMFLVLTIASLAGLFVLLHAFFLAAIQILVYAGAVMVLFLFVIMLVQTRAEEEARVQLYTRQTWPAVLIALLMAGSFYFAMSPAQVAYRPPVEAGSATPVAPPAEPGERSSAGAGTISEDTQRVGEALYRKAALPFEIASVLLLVAMVGAVLLARGTKQEKYSEGD